MSRSVLLFLIVFLVTTFGCKPRDHQPPVTDTAGVDVTVDSSAADVEDEEETPPLPEITPDDTLIMSIDSAARRARAQQRSAPMQVGMAVGLTQYYSTQWCDGFLNGTVIGSPPNLIAGILRKADYCGMRVALTLPRKYLTTNNEKRGPFSLTRAKKFVDQVAVELNKLPVSLQDNLLYINTLDDMGCKQCWPPDGISKQTTAEFTRYARSKFPVWVVVGLRVDPVWMLGVGNWKVDLAVAQWHSKKGPKSLSGVAKQKAWYEAQRVAAPKVGVKRMNYTVNVHHCSGVGTPPCTANEVKTYGTVAINFDPDRNCTFLGFNYADYIKRTEYQTAWRALVALGRTKSRSCALC